MEAQLKAHIAQTLKQARQRQGLTQDELGERIGRTAESLSNIERGKSLPSLETLMMIAAVLQVPVAALFPSGEEERRPSAKRVRLEAEAAGIIRELPENTLETAIEQLKALAKMKG